MTRTHAWHWPVALLLALLLHGLAALWFLAKTEAQPVIEVAGTSGVVISLASALPVGAGAQPPNSSSATEATPASALPELPKSAEPEAATDSLPVVNEVVTPPVIVQDIPLPVVTPPVATAALSDAPTAPPIAKTYAIPAEELRAMQMAKRRREQAEELARQQQDEQTRQRAEANRQRIAANRRAQQQKNQRRPTVSPPSTKPAGEAVAANELAGDSVSQADSISDSGRAPNQTSGEATTPIAAGSSRGSSEIPDCRDDSDAGGNTSKAEYKTTLQRYLQARQKYPRRAAQRQQHGCVVAQIFIDRQGRVVTASIIRPSGHRLLDSAVLQLVKPGKKLPKPPAALANLNFKIPFNYRLN